MKRLFFLLPVFLLGSCGLFKKNSNGLQEPTGVETWFANEDFEEIRSSLMITYNVTSSSETYDFIVYPFTNAGYSYDYMINGTSGTVITGNWAKDSAVKYNTMFYGDTMRTDNMGTVWLSRKTYSDLLFTGKSTMTFSQETGPEEFFVKGTENISIGLQDSSITLAAVVLKNQAGTRKIMFLPDGNYPLILSMDIGFQVQIMRVDNAESGYDEYQIGPGSVLMYQLTEGGINNYTVTLSNQFWSDTVQKWHVKGNYSGSYEYDFDFVVSYEGKAVISPEFVIPLFTANKDEYTDKRTNWFVFNKKDINILTETKSGYLDVPHFAYNPDDMDTTELDPEDLERDRQAYRESYHTKFDLLHRGRMVKSSFVFTDKDSYEDKQIPSLYFYSLDHSIMLEVNNEGMVPFLLYYNDDTMWEIRLVHAGFPID